MPYAGEPCQVHQRLQWDEAEVRGRRAVGVLGLAPSGGAVARVDAAELPRIWRMMSSASVAVPSPASELVCPAGQTAERFWPIETNLEVSPKRSSR